jgi:hypothetical protein
VSGLDALVGSYSMQVASEPSYLAENFTAVPELFISFLVSVDTSSTATLVTIGRVSGAGSTVEVRISATRTLGITVENGGSGGGGSIPADGDTYRVGLHLQAGLVEIFRTTKDGAFGAPAARIMSAGVGAMSRLQLGIVSGPGWEMRFDNIRLDTRSF